MAELDTGSPSLVSQLSDHDTLMSGRGASEVNKAIHTTENCQLDNDKSDTLPSSNVSNNFKSNNGVSVISVNDDDKHLDQAESKDDVENVCKKSVEIEENMKNEQMSQSQCQEHSISSNGNNDIGNKDEKINNTIENKGKKREVHFPDDLSITRSCDPPDPWKNAPTWTTDELITAYKKSCELNGSKPAVKILQQLHSISTPGKRKESFVLKGEKLDQRQVECIEEVLRRVQFQLVDLEATHLDDECAVALFDMIEHYESACQLNVSFNRNIGARGWQACSRLVRRTPSLNFLDIRNCDLNERTIPIFGRALKMGCHLTVLHMEGMFLTTRPLIILVAALKMNDTLQELFLAENKLVPSDGVQLGNLLRYNHRLNLLDLRNNNLQDVGVSHLCDGLVEQKSGHGLRTLVLWNNQISYQAMHALGRAIASSASLETLNIGHNGITNEGIHLLKDGLLKTISLLRLGLQGTRISDEGAVALAEYIADSTILLRIDLRDNEIKTGGLMALSHAMRVNNSVTRIDLDKETKKESGMKDYADVQIRLLRDILTFQERNVQLVMEREEAERAKLERLAIEAEATREKEKRQKETDGISPLENVSNTESFTIIGPDSVEIRQEAQNSNMNEKEVSPSALNESESISSLPSKTFSEEEEHMPTNQRPSVLFARMGLQPQESLDSPRTPSDSSQVFHPPQKSSTRVPPHPSLPLPMPEHNYLSASTPPGEMLLSPQYYPKQLARKIFSVSRVNDDVCSSPPSDGLCEYDPLNVALVSLAPVTNPQAPVSAVCSLTAPACQISTETSSSSAVSSTTLFHDLANETVKHIVSTEEPDLPVLSSNACLSCPAESKSEEVMVSDVLLDNCDSEESSFQKDVESNSSNEILLTQDTDLFVEKECVKEPDVDFIADKTIGAKVDQAGESENTDKVCDKTLLNSEISIQDTVGAMENTPESSDISDSKLGSHHVTEADTHDNRDSNVNDGSKFLEIVPNVLQNDFCDEQMDKDDLFHSQNVSNVCSTSSALENSSPSFHESKDSDSNIENLTDDKTFPEIIPTVISEDASCPKEESALSSNDEDKAVASGVELDGVELSLEEDSWTSLETDESSVGVSSRQNLHEEKQPDFFTTLTMNGLTQELASALTSLDGSSPDCESSGPDEFEQELDAMIAEVQNNPPSSLMN